ncbi:hypothetical protein NA2_17172 [Nitratireductor pacificus pht-3B]|uniref:Aminotransferase class V domain-containing protein n=1 Tax=Nitratireductor pacificus pht-3B TaxID=391937 RepID=K2M9I6_9HYPH|nr:hypothetical protein NA2_17172 [Nitratireductor pacificus pht-3B]
MTGMVLRDFIHGLQREDLPAFLRGGLIGENAVIEGPCGTRPLIYADYVASGRALAQVEDFIRDQVLPYYANSHTEASYCGAFSTRLREAARAEIHRVAGADETMSVVFAGSGATAGLNKLVRLLQIAETVARGERVVVFTGPYEHHSNILPCARAGRRSSPSPRPNAAAPTLPH